MARDTGARAEPSAEQDQVEVGQVWEDNDPRSAGRRLRVLAVDATHAIVQSPTGLGRKTRIRLDRFRATSTGYRRISPPGRTGPDAPEVSGR